MTVSTRSQGDPLDHLTPTSTYRLQITADFDLFAAARVLPYLRDLGVGWVYLSPLLVATPGSDHGYDVVDHARVDPARGGAEGLAALSAEARRLGLGVIVDIVPNHVGIGQPWENPWWWDVLTHGRDSAYASAFDIDWDAGDGRLLVPVVGDDDSLDDGRVGHLRVEAPAPGSAATGELRYFDHRFPLAPGSLADDADETHRRQHYRLVSWRRGDQELNYRRFFTVTTLAAIRVEEQEWFDRSHAEIGRWFDEGLVDGLRVDHPDGLRDPQGYLDDLARLTGGAYVLVEKILALRDASSPGSSGVELEGLPHAWATAGTTGYDALALVDRVLTDPVGQGPLDALETRLRRRPVDWPSMIHDTKRAVADGGLGAETRRIVREVMATEHARHTGLTDEAALLDAVAELLACFPVYRSYLPEGRDHLEQAVALARSHRPDLAATLDELVPVLADPASPPALRFQQTSGMVMAKGVEDCAFYRWSRLTSLNEVGADPAVFAASVSEFHDAMAVRQDEWPHALTAGTTHDTKRSEDVRARLAVLAELPDLWVGALDELLRLAPLPDPGFGSLLWQAVVGAWPASRDRLHGYAEKAMREAGDRTAWTAPDEAYETAVHAAVDAAYDDDRVRAVLDGLVGLLAGPGWSNALAAKLVSLTMPGVPDVYQGTELWELSLVDPDNRRPVDFDQRREILAAVRDGARPVVTPEVDDLGAAKLLVTQAALTLRRNQPHRFTGYAPVEATGEEADHVLAFDRGGALTVVTRLPVGLARRGWGATSLRLPEGEWADLLTGREHSGETTLDALLSDYPVALLVREES